MKDSPLLALAVVAAVGILIMGAMAIFAPRATCEQRGGIVETYDCHSAVTCHGADGRLGFICYPTKHCLERCVGAERAP